MNDSPSTSGPPLTDVLGRLKLSIVSSRFWPYSSATDFAVRDFAESMTRAGVQVELITAGWDKSSPATFQFRNFSVQRIYRSTTNPLGGYRYLKNLKRYLSNSDTNGIIFFDAIFEYKHLAKRFSGQLPLTVRLHDHWFQPLSKIRSPRPRELDLLDLADRVIVESEITQRTIEQTGVEREKIIVVQDVILPDPSSPNSRSGQAIARQAIGAAHPMLTLSPSQRLVVCAAAMFGDAGMTDLIESWQMVTRKRPSAKLWIIGHGPDSHQIWRRVMAEQLTDSIIMLGQFDDLKDAFLAADLYVHPLHNDASCGMLRRSLLSGLCSIVSQPLADRMQLVENHDAMTIAPANPKLLAATILDLIDNPERRTQIGLAAVRQTNQTTDIDRDLRPYLSLYSRSTTNTPI